VSTTSVARCTAPSGYSTYSTDCDDSDASRDPGNTEVCDDADVDEDCDTLADDSDPSTSTASKTAWFIDADADGYGDDAGVGSTRCSAPGSDYVAGNDDCDDADAAVNPAADDVCFDSVDGDCNGSTGCDKTDADSSRELIGEAAGDVAGAGGGLAGAGDVNGDGYDDVIVGAYSNDSGGSAAGRAYVVHGDPAGADLDLSAASAILTGEDASDLAGFAVTGLGDFNGDGYDDVAVGRSFGGHLQASRRVLVRLCRLFPRGRGRRERHRKGRVAHRRPQLQLLHRPRVPRHLGVHGLHVVDVERGGYAHR
jgi:hypothetical protein